MNGSITTPDKPLPITHYLYKNSSSQKKSAIKMYRQADIKQSRIPRPACYDANNKRQKLQTRNCKMEGKRPTKLDFDSHRNIQVNSTSRPRKSLNPSTASYKKISQISSYSNMASGKDKRMGKH